MVANRRQRVVILAVVADQHAQRRVYRGMIDCSVCRMLVPSLYTGMMMSRRGGAAEFHRMTLAPSR